MFCNGSPGAGGKVYGPGLASISSSQLYEGRIWPSTQTSVAVPREAVTSTSWAIHKLGKRFFFFQDSENRRQTQRFLTFSRLILAAFKLFWKTPALLFQIFYSLCKPATFPPQLFQPRHLSPSDGHAAYRSARHLDSFHSPQNKWT